jgi:hypothetical protein
MTDQRPMPDPEKVKQTLATSRRRRLEMEISGIELEEVIAKLEHHNRQQRLNRIKDHEFNNLQLCPSPPAPLPERERGARILSPFSQRGRRG